MLEILSSIMYVVIWVLIGAMLVAVIVTRRAVRGTHKRYVAKTCFIFTIVLYLIAEFLHTLILVHLAENEYQRGMHIVVCAFMYAYYIHLLYRVLSEDDDDWFNDQWKKLKRWVRNIRRVRQLKPAYVK